MRIAPLAVPLCFLLLLPVASEGQAPSTLTGMVRSAAGTPVVGAQVQVIGTRAATVTDENGAFRLLSLPVGTSVIRISHPDHVTLTERVDIERPSALAWDFELLAPQYVLDQMVARALRTAQPPNGVVEAEELERADAMSDVLDGVAGVTLVRSGGEVGRGYHLRVRGAKSFRFNRLPLVYVDGIRVNPGGVDGGVGILELLSPETIGRVEVLRGASAEVRFGPGASDGVLLISTRRGGS